MSTVRGHHEIKLQTGGYSAFAVATVELAYVQGPSELHLLTADGYADAAAWRPAVAFGLAYAVERTQTYRPTRATVTLRATHVDSTQAVVALAVARAALSALGHPGESPPDLDGSAVVFPLG